MNISIDAALVPLDLPPVERITRHPWRVWAIHAVTVTFSLTLVTVCETMFAMIHRSWRLSESGKDNLGLACTNDGLVLGRTPLIERRDNRFVVRERNEIERLLARAYQIGVVVDRLMPALTTVASALNANDQCLARIAAVHLRIPDLPNEAARREMEAEDILIRSAECRSALHPLEIHKASPDDPKHPGWPAGTPGGRGGQFRPKDGATTALTQLVKDLVTRREMRTNLVAGLHVGLEALGNLIPGVDVAADAALLTTIAQTISEYRQLAVDATAALDFVKQAPYSLENLQVSSSYQEFQSYSDFVKLLLAITKMFGSADDGNQYHHIVTQGGSNAENIPQKLLQNTDNIIMLPTLLHEMVSDEYLQPAPDNSGRTLYQWLQAQPYDVQREVGLNILRDLGILN